jgi:hypothetical protein
MKKFFAIILMTFLLLTFSTTAFAEDTTSAEDIVVDTEAIETEEVDTKEAVTEVVDDPNDLTVDDIINFLKDNWEELAVGILVAFIELIAKRRNNKLDTAITTANNNAVEIANNSTISAKNMLDAVGKYDEKMSERLAELTAKIEGLSKHLSASRLANKAMGDEVAKLITLANLPNSVKDELYASHIAAMNELLELEKALETEEPEVEVKENEETDS